MRLMRRGSRSSDTSLPNRLSPWLSPLQQIRRTSVARLRGSAPLLRFARGSARLRADRAVIGLGDEEGPVALGDGNGLAKRLGFRRGQDGEDLLLIALDALRTGHDRDQLRKAFQPGQPECGEAAVEAHIGDAVWRHAAADDTRAIDFGR